jgi:transposase InsO family protein
VHTSCPVRSVNTSLTHQCQDISDTDGRIDQLGSMRRKAVTMEQKLAAMFTGIAGDRATVTQVCAELGISRDTYYRYRHRLLTEGLAGLQPRSRAPQTSPTRTSEAMTEMIVAARKTLEREGWDNGALSIRARLLHDGIDAPPAARTIHRVLLRQGLIEPEPRKRPRSSYRRFVFPATDDCWQIDAFEYALADPAASVVVVFEILDDHSRYNLDSLAWPAETTEGAWTAMTRAISGYGTPRMVLTDNGLAFTGRHVHHRVLFEKNLAHLGIKLINSRPRHPQTTGKNERAHRTAQRWLAAQPPSPTCKPNSTATAPPTTGAPTKASTTRPRYNAAWPAPAPPHQTRPSPSPTPTSSKPAPVAATATSHSRKRSSRSARSTPNYH